MTTHDRDHRTARLAAAAATRTADATARALRAITRLNATKQPITFVSVARTAGVSTSFLYQHPGLRREICEHRGRAADQSPTASTGSATVESLRTKLQVVLQRNREEVTVLRAENEVLRSRVLELNHRRTSTSRTG